LFSLSNLSLEKLITISEKSVMLWYSFGIFYDGSPLKFKKYGLKALSKLKIF
jgi:hypothetical protein